MGGPVRCRRARAQVLIESSGISEPLPVAETFTFRDQGTGVALNDVARLHNLVTVVDAASVFEQLGTIDTLVDRGWHDVAGDKRTVAHLLCDQLDSAGPSRPMSWRRAGTQSRIVRVKD